ncbi:MAG: hypothetical protein HOE45_11515 [Gammaproteobacteria bacterium]|jgi:hypothetical protein|nr:hypothetical protein [Gammaproteobacteria bacterium]
MKKIDLKSFVTVKEFSIQHEDGEIETKGMEFKYSDIICQLLDFPPEGGFTPLEMKVRYDIIDLIDTAVKGNKKSVTLEDGQFEKVYGLITGHSFPFMDKGFIEMMEYLKKVKQVD